MLHWSLKIIEKKHSPVYLDLIQPLNLDPYLMRSRAECKTADRHANEREYEPGNRFDSTESVGLSPDTRTG